MQSLEIICRTGLFAFICWLVVYRDFCFGAACKISSNANRVFLRWAAGAIGIVGMVNPIVGVLLSVFLLFYIMESKHYAKAREIARTVQVDAGGTAASYAARSRGSRGARDARGEKEPAQKTII